jgi:hypothetical protein
MEEVVACLKNIFLFLKNQKEEQKTCMRRMLRRFSGAVLDKNNGEEDGVSNYIDYIMSVSTW